MQTRTVVVIYAALVVVGCSYVGRGPTRSPTMAIASPSESPSAAVATSRPTSSVTTRASTSGFVPADEAMDLLFQCGVIGRVASYFRVPEGNDIWDHFPRMGLSPEIEGKSNLFVAVYDGEVDALVSGQPGASREPLTDALCVFEDEGIPNVYVNVSREGMRLPPGAYVAAPDEWLLPTPPS